MMPWLIPLTEMEVFLRTESWFRNKVTSLYWLGLTLTAWINIYAQVAWVHSTSFLQRWLHVFFYNLYAVIIIIIKKVLSLKWKNLFLFFFGLLSNSNNGLCEKAWLDHDFILEKWWGDIELISCVFLLCTMHLRLIRDGKKLGCRSSTLTHICPLLDLTLDGFTTNDTIPALR